MIGDLYNANNVVVGQAACMFAAVGTALPTLDKFVLTDPFSLVPWQQGSAPYAWNPMGATDQGWQLGMNKTTAQVNIEEQSTPVGTTMNSQLVTIQGALSEETTANLALAYNGKVTTNAATATLPGWDEVNLSDDVIRYAVALISARFDGKPQIFYAPSWTQLNNAETSFRRANGAKRMYPISFSTVCKTSDIRLIRLTAPKTS